MKFILIYLLCLLTWLTQSQQNCINRPKQTLLKEQIHNLNIFELITNLRGEMLAERQRFSRKINTEYFLGSNLFDGIRKKCFSIEEVSLLSARVEFQQMIPIIMPPVIMSDQQINDILRYFSYGHFLMNSLKKDGSNHIIKKAFYDTVGGFLHFYLIPIAKASFYAGRVKVDTCFKVFAHYEKCRRLLNTNGNGWRIPDVDPLKHLGQGDIMPLKLRLDDSDLDEGSNYCRLLDLESGANDGDIIDDMMLVSLPKIDIEDSDGYLGNIYLPYERKRTYNLRSPNSAGILIKFYKTVIGCYHEKSINPSVYQTKLRDWIIERVQIHLNDDVFYAGFASVLRLYESVRLPGQRKTRKRKKKAKVFFGDRWKRGGAEIGEALRQERSKTFKFINLENKVNRILPEMLEDECGKNWLDDPIITGKPKPQEKCDESDEEKKIDKADKKSKNRKQNTDKKSSKTKSNNKNKNIDANEKSGSKKKWKWGFGRLYKKGSWGGIFPRLKGLSILSKIWEIFKFLFFFILFLFVIIFFVKICAFCCTLSAGPLKCCEYITRALIGFGKIFLNVLSAMFAGCARLCCVKVSKTKEPTPKNQVMVVVDGNKQKTKSAQSPPINETTYYNDIKKEKDKLKTKKKKVKEKKSKKEKPAPLQPSPVATNMSLKTPNEKAKTKDGKPLQLSSSESDINKEKTKKSKKKDKSKKDNKKPINEDQPASTRAEPDKQKRQEAGKYINEESDIEDTKSLRKNRKCGCCPAAEKCEQQPLIKQPIRRKKSRAERKTGRGRKRNRCGNTNPTSSLNSSSQDSSDQDSADEEKNDGKSSWKTFYDF